MLLIGSHPVFFKNVPGQFNSIDNLNISDAEITEENTAALLRYKKPWIIKNQASSEEDKQEEQEDMEEGEGLKISTYLPCIPNLDLIVNQRAEENKSGQFSSVLQNPLVKCRQDVSNQTEGYICKASGKRSAILIDTSDHQSFIRLKGCGNLEQGFPLEPMAFPMDSDEVRGCQFINTVYREMEF